MTEKKIDGVMEVVHYQPDGMVAWVRGYLRRGATWSDRVILKRDELVKEIKTGKKMMIGQRRALWASTFDVSAEIQVKKWDEKEVLTIMAASSEKDQLGDLPVI